MLEVFKIEKSETKIKVHGALESLPVSYELDGTERLHFNGKDSDWFLDEIAKLKKEYDLQQGHAEKWMKSFRDPEAIKFASLNALQHHIDGFKQAKSRMVRKQMILKAMLQLG